MSIDTVSFSRSHAVEKPASMPEQVGGIVPPWVNPKVYLRTHAAVPLRGPLGRCVAAAFAARGVVAVLGIAVPPPGVRFFVGPYGGWLRRAAGPAVALSRRRAARFPPPTPHLSLSGKRGCAAPPLVSSGPRPFANAARGSALRPGFSRPAVSFFVPRRRRRIRVGSSTARPPAASDAASVRRPCAACCARRRRDSEPLRGCCRHNLRSGNRARLAAPGHTVKCPAASCSVANVLPRERRHLAAGLGRPEVAPTKKTKHVRRHTRLTAPGL